MCLSEQLKCDEKDIELGKIFGSYSNERSQKRETFLSYLLERHLELLYYYSVMQTTSSLSNLKEVNRLLAQRVCLHCRNIINSI